MKYKHEAQASESLLARRAGIGIGSKYMLTRFFIGCCDGSFSWIAINSCSDELLANTCRTGGFACKWAGCGQEYWETGE